MVDAPEDSQARLLKVVRLGHPTLRTVADPVPEAWFSSGRLHDMGRDLIHTMIEEEGVGLAAPQVAEPLRLFAFWIPGTDGRAEVEPTVIVNPVVRDASTGVEEGWEGCLSIPGLRGLVPRVDRVKVKGRTVAGDSISFTADGFSARVIQHETDHLDGIVFLDRMTSVRSLAYDEEWERYVLGSNEEDA